MTLKTKYPGKQRREVVRISLNKYNLKHIKKFYGFKRWFKNKLKRNLQLFFKMKFVFKQKLRRHYGNLKENQFHKLYKIANTKKEYSGIFFLTLLERRLDAIVSRMHFSSSIFNSRQLINHGHVLVNGKIIKNPNFLIYPGDLIQINKKYLSLLGNYLYYYLKKKIIRKKNIFLFEKNINNENSKKIKIKVRFFARKKAKKNFIFSLLNKQIKGSLNSKKTFNSKENVSTSQLNKLTHKNNFNIITDLQNKKNYSTNTKTINKLPKSKKFKAITKYIIKNNISRFRKSKIKLFYKYKFAHVYKNIIKIINDIIKTENYLDKTTNNSEIKHIIKYKKIYQLSLKYNKTKIKNQNKLIKIFTKINNKYNLLKIKRKNIFINHIKLKKNKLKKFLSSLIIPKYLLVNYKVLGGIIHSPPKAHLIPYSTPFLLSNKVLLQLYKNKKI